MRFPADVVTPGMGLSFQGGHYTLGQPVPQTLQHASLPIGVLMSGYTEQFLLRRDNRPVGAAWFYFYGSIEGNRWAVLDEVELESAMPVCA